MHEGSNSDDKIENNNEEFDHEDEKKWLMDQIKYIQLAIDSLELERLRKEEFIKNVQSSYDTFLRGILTVLAFIATFAVSIAAINSVNFPRVEILMVNFVVGALLYLCYLVIRLKTIKKLRKPIDAIYILLTALNMIREVIGQLAFSIDVISVKQIHLLNAYLAIVTVSKFPLRDAYDEILSTGYLRYYHKMFQAELKAAELTIGSGAEIFKEKKR